MSAAASAMDPPPPHQQCSSTVKVSSSSLELDTEIPPDLIIRIGDFVFPLHKAVMVPKCGYIRRAVAAAKPSSKNGGDGNHNPTAAAAAVELDLSALPGGADAFDKAARYCYGANFEITPHNAAALRCAAAFLDMRHHPPSADLAARVDEFLARSALRSLPGAAAVLRSCEADPTLLRAAEELGVARRAADAVALAVCRDATFPSSSSSHPPGWWKAELAALSPGSFGKVVTALRCRRAEAAVLAAAAGAYAELVLAEVLAAPRDCPEQRALLESVVVDALPSPGEAPGIPPPLLCRLLRAAVSTEASATTCRDLELRVAAVLEKVTSDDLLTVALDAAGDRVRHADTVRRVVTAFFERHTAAAAPESDRTSHRRRRASMSSSGGTTAAEMAVSSAEKVAATVDEVAAEMATEEGLAIGKFVGVVGAVPRDARACHDGLYHAVDVYLKTHPGMDELQREKVCAAMDPLKLSYAARLHAAQNRRLPLQAALTALYHDQLKLRSGGEVAVVEDVQPPPAAKAEAALARENEALRSELAQMRAYLAGMQQQHGGKGIGGGSTTTMPASPARTVAAKKASLFLGSVSRSLSRLNPFRGGWTAKLHLHTGSVAAGGRQCKTMQHVVVTPKRRRSSIS